VTQGRRLVLLRHGRTAWTESGRAQGHADIELDDLGHAHAAAAATYLAGLGPAALWTSDLARARQTCGYVEQATGLAAKTDQRLREFDVGARQGMTMAEFAESFPVEHDSWVRGDQLHPVEGAEDGSEVVARMVPALREFLEALDPGETGIVVTHGACLKVGLVGLLEWPADLAATLRGVDNCGWATVAEGTPGARLRLEAYNQQAGPAGGGLTDL
jgi:probable phosphoglycerate mutase